jgi:hypothetical protein
MHAGRATMIAMSLLALVSSAWGGSTKCTMRYSLSGWSVFYATASGSGTITCDNGQSARVWLRAKGGGITAGKSKVVGGIGSFSDVSGIDELFGKYAAGEAHAGMVASSSAQVVTKGTVSLALAGKGKGIDLGFTFGEFVITKQRARKRK